ncbi:SusC/RagA family TonB-linked outer membrane protein [Flavobacterium sp. LHD-80]|uniref:SusC/RagA family TonB-linked outer membrane protein n=1 Tax=Flavobacterium sp. LHD-80 TaxID=3071411 RepID=UPI0027E0DDB0|nr:SusC/RagA family TonB-linked outer membrane protein [Flavobacterium sp. LHD-80]MDQ6471992.1 SusC/RagA family TonB-linked outer membrane protein [Flavobacterium sp. LHD-80]
MKLKFNGFLVLLLVLVAQLTFAQERAVSGTVSDNAGMPLPGVSVLVKGTKSGTQTDFDGKFTIKASTSQVLVFSYIGMKTQEVAASSSVINIKLAGDAQELEGVVVTTALGIKREKKSLGYATQKIDGDEVNKTPSTNFVNSMSGKVAGLQIKNNNNLGGSTNVVIRGYKSIGFNNQALFVIDGVPVDNNEVLGNTSSQKQAGAGYDYGNAASDINPADIESVNVLKGAAATALYGSRAANGAIMITTKKGKQQNGLGVSLSSSVSIGTIDKSTFAKYQTQYGEGYFPSFRTTFDVNGDGTLDNTVRTNHDASFGPAYDSSKLVYGWDSFVPESSTYKTARPWEIAKHGPADFFENPVVNSNTIAVNGGNDKGTFNLSYTNLSSTGLMPNSEQKKNSFLGNASYKLTDKLTASFFANYVVTDTKGRNGTGYNGNLVSGFRQWWATNVDVLEQRAIYQQTGKNYTWNANSPTNITPAFWNNPYFQLYENYESDTRNRFLGNASVNYKITSWLDATGRVSVDTYSDFQEERRANGSYAGDPFGIARSNEESGYQRLNRNYSEFNYDLMLNFNTNLNENLNLKGVAGINIRRQQVDQILASTSGGLYVPKLFSLTNSVNTVEKPVEAMSDKGVNGYYISASLGYKDYLFLDATLRRDVSSTLPSDNNEYYYPSVSGSYVFSNTLQQDWLTLGKVRLGYAEVGNDAPFAKTLDTYTSNSPFGTPLYSVPSTRNNPNLKPERTKSWEAGLELQMAQRRIGLDLSVYKTNTVDQIVDLPVSEATGYTKLFKNVGNIENKGIEATLTLVPVKADNFTWTIVTNWAKNKNKVVALDEGIDNYQLGSFQGGITINATVGQPYGTIQGSDYVYLNGQRVIDPATGKYQITGTNDNVIGNFTPDWTGGINNIFNYKKFSFSFLIDMQKGGDVFSLDRWYGEGSGLYTNTVYTNDLGNPVRNTIADGGGHILPGVYPDGTPNTTRIEANDGTDGSFGYLGSANKDYVYDASYIKLRELTLGYTFDKKVLGGAFQELYLGVSGNNLWIIHKNLPDSDPEAGLSAGNLQGYQSGVLPTTKTFAVNLKAKF